MRKEQLHISNCYSLDCIEIASIRILVISNYLVKNDTINILSAESMKNLREIFHVNSPPREYHPFVNAW